MNQAKASGSRCGLEKRGNRTDNFVYAQETVLVEKTLRQLPAVTSMLKDRVRP